MKKEHTHTASSLGEVCDIIHAILKEWDVYESTTLPWYRGQSDFTWSLLPKLYRNSKHAEIEREIVRDFKLKSRKHIKRIPENEVQWLILMQHYGAPTRLLDWSESYMHALFFCVHETNKECDGALWIMHPWWLNQNSIQQQSVPTDSSSHLDEHTIKGNDYESVVRSTKGRTPIAFRPTHNNDRIIAQKGTFTIHGCKKKSIDDLFKKNKNKRHLLKIKINGQSKKRIYSELCQAGITLDAVYPDLVGLCLAITEKYTTDKQCYFPLT